MDLLRFILQRVFDVNALDFMNIGTERAFIIHIQLKQDLMMLSSPAPMMRNKPFLALLEQVEIINSKAGRQRKLQYARQAQE